MNQGAGGVNQQAGYQAGLGQALTGQGASQLNQLFSPQYQQQQIQAAMQPATEDIREQFNSQNAQYGGAGALGSSRAALAGANLASLGQARLGNIAAQTAGNIATQRQNASNTLLGAGQTATGNAGNLYNSLLGTGAQAGSTAAQTYGNILNAGNTASGQAAQTFGNILGAGQTATGAAQSGYSNLANQGQAGLTGANQAAASRIGYAGTPQDVFSKYASVIFGVPQQSTTPNFAGTQGSTSSGKGMNITAPKWG